MKKYKNFLFVPYQGVSGTKADTSDGYLTESLDGNRRIKLPHKNYTLLGVADECINSWYAEEFAEKIVEKDEFNYYYDYELKAYHYGSASDSFQTLARKLGLEPTDYILRDDSDLPGINPQIFKIILDETN